MGFVECLDGPSAQCWLTGVRSSHLPTSLSLSCCLIMSCPPCRTASVFISPLFLSFKSFHNETAWCPFCLAVPQLFFLFKTLFSLSSCPCWSAGIAPSRPSRVFSLPAPPSCLTAAVCHRLLPESWEGSDEQQLSGPAQWQYQQGSRVYKHSQSWD